MPDSIGEVKFEIFTKEFTIEWGKNTTEVFKPSKWKFIKCKHKYINAKEVKTIIIKGNSIEWFTSKVKYSSMEIKFKNCNSLENLEIYNAGLKTLDVTKLPKLLYLRCHKNSLKTLDLSKNKELKYLNCYDNSLTTLDISKLPKLQDLNCAKNKLKILEVSKNKSLDFLVCDKNSLKKLDLSNLGRIGSLSCKDNEFKAGSVLIKEKSLTKMSILKPDRTDKIYKIVKQIIFIANLSKMT